MNNNAVVVLNTFAQRLIIIFNLFRAFRAFRAFRGQKLLCELRLYRQMAGKRPSDLQCVAVGFFSNGVIVFVAE